MTAAVRLTYRGRDGEPIVEDLVGPSNWSPLQYHAAIRRQRHGIEIIGIEPIERELMVPRGTTPERWWVTLRIPGRPTTSIFVRGTIAESRRMALMGAEPGAQIIRIVPACG